MATPRVQLALHAPVWTNVVMGTVASLIIATYLLYIQEGGVKFLPTISDTWCPPPGSYLSRFFGGFCGDLLYMPVLFVYWASATAQKPYSQALAIQGLVSVFLFSWIPAICDTGDDVCRGNANLHDFVAVSFFTLFDFYCIFNTCVSAQMQRPADSVIQGLALAVSCVSKLRWFVPFKDTPLAVFEWCDVASISLWTCHFVATQCSGVKWAVVKWDREAAERDAEEEYGPYISLKVVRTCHVALLFFTVTICLISTAISGKLPEGRVPFITDTWVYSPPDWFARWGIIQACSAAIFSQLMLSYVSPLPSDAAAARYTRQLENDEEESNRQRQQHQHQDSLLSKAAYTASGVSFISLAIVASVDQQEHLPWIKYGTMAFFSLYNGYMLLNINTRTGMILALGALLSKLRWTPMATGNTEAVVEWVDMLLVLVFAYHDVHHRPGSAELYIMVIKDSSSRGGDDAKDEDDALALVADAPARL